MAGAEVGSTLADAGLSPAELNEITKQTIEGIKAPGEVAKNLGAGDYYKASADYERFKTTDKFLGHQLAVAVNPQLAHNDGLMKLEQYKQSIREGDIAKMGKIATPSLLGKYTGMHNMGDVYRVFKEDAGNILMTAINAEQSSANRAQQWGFKTWEDNNRALVSLTENLNKLKSLPSKAEWDAKPEKERQMLSLSGVQPRNTQQENDLQTTRQLRYKYAALIHGKEFADLLDRTDSVKITDFNSLPKAGKPESGLGSMPAKSALATPLNPFGVLAPIEKSQPVYNPYLSTGGL